MPPPRLRDRLHLFVSPGSPGPASAATVGACVATVARRSHDVTDDVLVRVYLRPAPRAVAPLVHAVTTALVERDSWLLKVAPTPDGLSRPDAVVAYLAGPTRQGDRDAVVAALGGLTSGPPPPLTEQLADGVGWAADPGTGESFGEVRCGAIAAAYAGLAGLAVSGEQWLEKVADEFRWRGIDPAAPHRSGMTVEVPR